MEELVNLRHGLHQLAELSLSEHKTRGLIKACIKGLGLEPVEYKGCVYTVYNPKGERAIALRADIDALPLEEEPKAYCSLNKGVAHLCGHDGHTAVLLGAMQAIVQGGCPNKVIFIFQCAEEIGCGGAIGAEIALSRGAEQVYGWHNIPGLKKGQVILKKGTFACGSCGIIINMEGKSAHAAYPEAGISPVEAISRLLSLVKAINQRESKGLLRCTVIGLSCGGEDFGIAAYSGVLRLTLRAELSSEYEAARQEIVAFSESCGREYGLKINIDYKDYFPSTENDEALTQGLENICKAKGFGYSYLKNPMSWSEDFGHYTAALRGCYFGIGAGEACPKLHHKAYDFPDDITEGAVRLITALANSREVTHG